jgi:hypothetical protein
MMDIANAPVSAYSNLVTNTMLDPYLSKTQTAVQNQSALQAAQAQQDIQAQLDPMARAQREMRLGATASRLGKLYGVDPNAFVASGLHPGAYQTANLQNAPSLADLTNASSAIAAAIRPATVNKLGNDPRLLGSPSKAGAIYGGGISV